MPKAGVYAIQNLENGRVYVGSSANITQRWYTHRHMLRKRDHICRDLQTEWDLYGSTAFVFVVLAYVDDVDGRILLEQHYIDVNPNHYNTNGRAGSGPRPGFSLSAETRRKLSVALKGRRHSPESIARMSAAKKGKPNPKHGEAIRGRKASDETKAKMSASRRGVPWSELRMARFVAKRRLLTMEK